jgi:hypothetical protein
LGLLKLLNKEQQIIFGKKNILRNHSDIPKNFKNKIVSDNPLPYSTQDSGKVFKEGVPFLDYFRNYCKILKKNTAVVRLLEMLPNFIDCPH